MTFTTMKTLFLTFLIYKLVLCKNDVYFYLSDTEQKCFMEEIPEDTLITILYKIEVTDPQSQQLTASPAGIGMHVSITSPERGVALSKLYSSFGKIAYTSAEPGEHEICLRSNSTHGTPYERQPLKISLDIEVGEHGVDYNEAAKKEKLTEVELRVRQLNDQIVQIAKEQNYQRQREEKFRKTSESTNKRVLYWSIAQTVVLVLTGVWQMKHLKSFFEAKKLV